MARENIIPLAMLATVVLFIYYYVIVYMRKDKVMPRSWFLLFFFVPFSGIVFALVHGAIDFARSTRSALTECFENDDEL